MATVRDTQRQKLYDAEALAFGSSALPREGAMTLPEIQQLVDRVLASKVIQRHYPRAQFALTATDGRSRRRGGYHASWYGDCTIAMPRWTRCQWYTLHEIAHHLSHDPREPHHGWRFAACYLHLVRVYMGRDDEEKLKAALKAKKVRYREPRKREMSDEQRQAARDRMLALHEARRSQ